MVRISLVEDIFRAILNMVVNRSMVGKKDISRTSLENMTPNKTVNAMAILHASSTSISPLLMGTIIMTNAAIRYAATPISAFFMSLLLSLYFSL